MTMKREQTFAGFTLAQLTAMHEAAQSDFGVSVRRAFLDAYPALAAEIGRLREDRRELWKLWLQHRPGGGPFYATEARIAAEIEEEEGK